MPGPGLAGRAAPEGVPIPGFSTQVQSREETPGRGIGRAALPGVPGLWAPLGVTGLATGFPGLLGLATKVGVLGLELLLAGVAATNKRNHMRNSRPGQQ